MTLNNEGLLPCPFCGSEAKHYHRDYSSGWSNTDWVCCGNKACGGGTCLHETKDIAIAAWNRRALPPVDGLEVVEELNRIIAEEAADFADAADHAVEAGERPDLWDREVEVAVHTLSQASSVIAGLKREKDAYETGLVEFHRELSEAEARISSLEEEIKRLREALKPFANVAEHDIGDDETNDDLFRPMQQYNRAQRLTVGHLRAARQVLGDHNG